MYHNCFNSILYKYDASNGTYTFVGKHSHDGPGTYGLKIYFKETKHTKILYNGYCGGVCDPMTYFIKYDNGASTIYKVPESEYFNDNFDEVYDEVKDLLPTTTFILKKQSDNQFSISEITIE